MQYSPGIEPDLDQDYFSQHAYTSNSFNQLTLEETSNYRSLTPNTLPEASNFQPFSPRTPAETLNYRYYARSTPDTSDLIRSLQKPDAIFEPNVVDTVSCLVSDSVENIGQIFGSLCHSYTGEPSKIQLLSDLFDEFGSSDTQPKADSVCKDALMNILLEKYDTVKIDQVVKDNIQALNLVIPLIQSSYWRRAIYDLSEKHPEGLFLNILIRKIADANYINEIKHLKSASTNIDVFSKVLLDQFDNLITADEAGVSQSMPDLIKTAVQHPHSYLFVQALIKHLSQERNGYPLRKLAKELEKGVSNNNMELVDNLRNLIAAPPQPIAQSILRIPPTPGDIVNLHKQYSQEPLPSPIYLRDPQLLYWLLNNAFVPSEKTLNLKQDLKEKYLYLAAYAASAEERDDGTIDDSRVNTTFETLKKLQATLSRKGVIGLEFNAIVKDLLVYIETPIASMATIFWIKYILRETAYYEKHFKTNEVPLPHYVLEEIAFRHQYQRFHVFNAYKAELESSTRFTPEAALRRQLMERMAYLVQIGFVMQVMTYIEKTLGRLDEKLVITACGPPYSEEFYISMLKLIEFARVQLDSQLDTRPMIVQFFADRPPTIDNKYNELINNLVITFSS
ncbi:22926_t:CDS:10 [Dentiscutata erythropus]|uniref:22926_t:CDS:1 n=1 Tax=Dentiscutata erythropus TaxID=1348616 RepID=A0A9N9G230_9GLOM|nr:22926_t:CDS:10 [Dentiscutata erythropus]